MTSEEKREKNRVYYKKYREEHKTEEADRIRRYKEEHKEEIKKKGRIYYQEHKETRRKYNEDHKTQIAEYHRKWRESKRAQKLDEMKKMGITVDYRYTKDKHPFCSEPVSQIEGYEHMKANPTVRYLIHHRRETHTEDGLHLGTGCYLSASMLKNQGLYYNRPASELIWMSRSEHTKLHHTKNNL